MLRDYLHLIRFDKPIGTLLLLWPTWWGLWLAYSGMPPLGIFIVFSLGVFLTRAAGCAINDYADAGFDGMVERTNQRPLVTGAISKKNALLVTLGLSLLAFILACLFLSSFTLYWSLPALLIFVSYPFFKRFFAIPQLYLGVAFSFGILMAYAEAQQHIPALAWLLFMANVLWVLAYDTIYALVDIDDDRKIGIKTSALTFGKHVISIIMLCYVGFMGLLLVIANTLALSWVFYLGWLISGVLIFRIYTQIRDKERLRCFKAFLFNNYIGMVLFIGIALDYGLKFYAH